MDVVKLMILYLALIMLIGAEKYFNILILLRHVFRYSKEIEIKEEITKLKPVFVHAVLIF